MSSTTTSSSGTTTTDSSSASRKRSNDDDDSSTSSDSDSSSSGSSSSSSGSSSSSVEQHATNVVRNHARPPPKAGARSATSSSIRPASSSSAANMTDMEAFKESEVGKKVGNPSMTYSRPDTEFIKIPVLPSLNPKDLASQPWGLVPYLKALHNFKVCGPKEYRVVDYLITASELLLDELSIEYETQRETFTKKLRAGGKSAPKGPMKFTWKNGGKLAINFALACDCAKLLSDLARFGRANGAAVAVEPDTIVIGYVHYIQRMSQIPEEILGIKTYLVKLQDWKKGGTRYTASHSSNSTAEGVNNVQFPTAAQRREKLESFIQGGREVEIVSKVVNEVFMTNVGGVLRPLRTAGGTIYTRAPKRTSAIQDVSSNGPGPVSMPRAPGSSIATKSIVGPPLQFNAFKQNIFSLFGGVVLHFPPSKLSLMGAFVRVIEKAPDRTDKHYCLRLITNVPSLDSACVYSEFDKAGGLLVLRQWILKAFAEAKSGCAEITVESSKDGTPPATAAQKRQQVRQNHVGLAHTIIELMANHFRVFSERTRTTWLAPTYGIPSSLSTNISAPLSNAPEATGEGRRHLTTTAYIASMIKGFAKASAVDDDLINGRSSAEGSSTSTILFEYTQKYNTTIDEKLRGVTSRPQNNNAPSDHTAATSGVGSPAAETKRLAWQIDPISDVLRDFPATNNNNKEEGSNNMELRDFVVDGGNGLASDESQLTPHQQAVLARERTNWKLLAAYHGVYAGVGINPYVGITSDGVRGSSSVVGGGQGGVSALSQLSNAAASAFGGGAWTGPCPFMPTMDLPLLTGPLSGPLISAVEASLGGGRGQGSSSSSAVSNNLLLTLDKLFNPIVQGLTEADKTKDNVTATPPSSSSSEVSSLTPEEGVAMRAFILGVVKRRCTQERVHLLTRSGSGFTLAQPQGVVLGEKRPRDESEEGGNVNGAVDGTRAMVKRPDDRLVPVWPTAEELLSGVYN